MVVSPEWKQAFYSLGAQLNMASLGMVMAYTATLLPALSEPSSLIKVELNTASWIAAIPGLSGVIPIVLLGPMMHYGGRKMANIWLAIPVLFGWVLTYLAGQLNSITMLFIGRFFQGLSTGSPYFISVCIGEFSSPKMRSTLLGIKPVCVVLGISVMHFMAYFLDWKRLALVGAIPPALGFVVTIFWPETPDWLVSRERYDEARIVFNSIRGYSKDGDHELKQLIESHKARLQLEENNKENVGVWRKMKSRVLWRPIGVLFFTVLVPIVGGRQFVPAYSVQLSAQLSGDKTRGYLYTVLGDVIALVAVFSSLLFVKIFRRRQLLFGSGIIGIVLLALCSCMLYIRTMYPSQELAWFSLCIFGVYYFIANAAFIPVSYILMGEIFPLEYRAIGSVIDGILGAGGMTIILGAMPLMERNIGMHGVLFVFGLSMLICLLYLYFELPETKNRTLHDIGDYFRGKSPKIRRENRKGLDNAENKSILMYSK